MNKKNTFISLSFFLIVLLFSCTKNSSTTFKYDITGCANFWDKHYTADTFSLEALNNTIHDFLATENIEVNYIEFEFDSTKVELCYACHCKTGTVVVVNTSCKNKRKMKRLGFYK